MPGQEQEVVSLGKGCWSPLYQELAGYRDGAGGSSIFWLLSSLVLSRNQLPGKRRQVSRAPWRHTAVPSQWQPLSHRGTEPKQERTTGRREAFRNVPESLTRAECTPEPRSVLLQSPWTWASPSWDGGELWASRHGREKTGSGSRNPDPRDGYVPTGSWKRLSTRPPTDTEMVVPKVTKNCLLRNTKCFLLLINFPSAALWSACQWVVRVNKGDSAGFWGYPANGIHAINT